MLFSGLCGRKVRALQSYPLPPSSGEKVETGHIPKDSTLRIRTDRFEAEICPVVKYNPTVILERWRETTKKERIILSSDGNFRLGPAQFEP